MNWNLTLSLLLLTYWTAAQSISLEAYIKTIMAWESTSYMAYTDDDDFDYRQSGKLNLLPNMEFFNFKVDTLKTNLQGIVVIEIRVSRKESATLDSVPVVLLNCREKGYLVAFAENTDVPFRIYGFYYNDLPTFFREVKHRNLVKNRRSFVKKYYIEGVDMNTLYTCMKGRSWLHPCHECYDYCNQLASTAGIEMKPKYCRWKKWWEKL